MAIASANVDQMRLLRLHWIPASACKTQASDFASSIDILLHLCRLSHTSEPKNDAVFHAGSKLMTLCQLTLQLPWPRGH